MFRIFLFFLLSSFMDQILESILIHTPREIRQAALKYLKERPDKIEALIEMSFSDSQPVGWRSAWVLSDLVKMDLSVREKVQSLSSRIVASFPRFNSPGQVREFLKIIQLINVEDNDMGILIDLCFNWLLDRKSDQSFRVYSMQIIFDYSKKEPDLLPELKAILEQEMEFAKPGFKSRGRKILKKIGESLK